MDLTGAVWRKASSPTDAGNCVEVSRSLPGIVAVRDSLDPSGPKLIFTLAEWRAFRADFQADLSDVSDLA
jgi:hypothetical protein